jgi:hypothetical protein
MDVPVSLFVLYEMINSYVDGNKLYMKQTNEVIKRVGRHSAARKQPAKKKPAAAAKPVAAPAKKKPARSSRS